MINPCPAGGYNITNLGAILFAKRLDSFPNLKRKAVRVIRYKGSGRIETVKEQEGSKGYAAGFEGLVDYVTGMLPTNELIGRALRKDVPMFPNLAIRELVANALIHQDFFVSGAGPMVELFEDRLEITNPGLPLVDTNRFLGSPPKSRNETLASFMRRVGVCEERGSGIEKVVRQTESYQLPAPLFETPNGFTRATLFAHQDFEEMDMGDRVRACYLHCCLLYVNHKKMNNSSLRERFGLSSEKIKAVSRIITKTAEMGLIVNPNASESRRHTFYVPFWSQSGDNI
jgi:predicted HTH transcriptional regulator